jgi:hypothetical protein
MKKLFYFILSVVVMTGGNWSMANAQQYYKKQFIEEDFNEIETLPGGWSVKTNTSSATYSNLGRNGGIAVSGQMLAFSGNGSGTRGAELVLPSTSTASFGYPADSIWNIEFDWTILTTAASLSERNAFAIIFSGSGGIATNDANGWYVPGIFGFYVYKNEGKIHYMNLDRDGLPKRADDGSLIPGETNGHAFLAGNSQSWRRATSSKDETGDVAPFGSADSLNLSSATDVVAALGGTYHITAKIDFKVASQKVLSMTITDLSNPENTATIGEQAFLAPTFAGSAATVTQENRIVTDLSVLSVINTRSSNGGNGNNAQLSGSGIDNLEIYILKESSGQANATVNYKDQDGNEAKAARVEQNLEIGEFFNLISSDKERFTNNGNYYAYNEEATHAANAAKGAGGESVEVAAGGVSLDVIFKKTAVTSGTYIWTGASGPNWDELQANFSVNNGAAIGYQTGNAVEFSKTDAANKEVLVAGIMDMGDKNITISAPDYSLLGTGRITGTGVTNVDVGATLGFDNRLDGGAAINTTSPVIIKHRAAAKTYKPTVANATIQMQTPAGREEPVPLPITGANETLNIIIDSVAPHTLTVTGAPTVNIRLNQAGRMNNTRWLTAFYSGSKFEKGTQVNVTSGVTDYQLPTGFGVAGSTGTNTGGVLDSVKVNLGDNVRIVRDYNENNAVPENASHSVINIGELTGSASSYLEGGWVDGRTMAYRVGSLGTDAVFNGSIRPYQTYTAATDTTTEVFGASTSSIGIIKVGTGSWTINGTITFPDNLNLKTMYSYITVQQGKLILNNEVYFPVNDTTLHAINVKTDAILELNDDIIAPAFSAIELTVDSAGTLICHGGRLGAYFVNLRGTIEGGAILTNRLSSFESATIKLKANSFTEGDYEQIETEGDIEVIGGTLDVTVESATQGTKAQLFKCNGNPSFGFSKILVNGEDITENTADTPDAKCYFDPDMGELVALMDFTGINKIDVNKEIKFIRYYDLLGRPVMKDAKGIVIRKITYTDDTHGVQKVFVSER